VTDLLSAHRNQKNRPGGYWIFDPSGVGVPHARRASWPLETVSSVSALTDGFFQLVSPFGVLPDLASLHQALRTQGLAELSAALFAAQERDPSCDRFPRFKKRDDCTALWGTIEAP
jgi:hypothetical protein